MQRQCGVNASGRRAVKKSRSRSEGNTVADEFQNVTTPLWWLGDSMKDTEQTVTQRRGFQVSGRLVTPQPGEKSTFTVKGDGLATE